MEKNTNPLLCDPITGVCEIPGAVTGTDSLIDTHGNKPLKITYFTDPICSTCWGIEAQLRKLKLEYGHIIDIDYRMGGLLPDWSYNSGGISKPSDVAHHWDEVSAYYDMPIDGNIWLEDPLPSSYPPSIAFKAAQMQDQQKALLFMRRIREMVFMEKTNIAKWENLAKAASQTGLDTTRLKQDFENAAKQDFQADLDLSHNSGVRGFPTLFINDSNLNRQTIYGFKPYQQFEEAILKLYPTAIKNSYDKSWQFLFGKFNTLTTREYAELSNLNKPETETLLQSLADQKVIVKHAIRNGDYWSLKS